MTQRKVLGRGLSALIPTESPYSPLTPTAPLPEDASSPYRMVAIERIRPNPNQPRKSFESSALEDLSQSIAAKGVLQPLVLRRDGDSYMIVAGERRWRAANKAGLTEVPAIVRSLSDSETMQLALIENIQRSDLDPLEEAYAYQNLIQEHGLTQEAVADAVGKKRATVANSLRLLKLPPSILEMLGQGKLTAGHARALMTLRSEAAQNQLAREIVLHKMSVRDAERRARALAKKRTDKSEDDGTISLHTRQVEERLTRVLGTRVKLHARDGKGKVEVQFHSLDQLNSILDRIEGGS